MPGRSVSVTFVSSHALLGGAERYLEVLLSRLDSGWIRSVVSLQEGPFADRLRNAGYRPLVLHTTGSPRAILASAWRLRRLFREHRPDIVHANGVKAALVCALATVGKRLPVVWVKHDFSWDGPLVRAIAHRCARVVGVSGAVVQGLKEGKVSVIPPGVGDMDIDRRASRAFLLDLIGAPQSASLVALIGRLHSVKGHHELLAIVPELRRRLSGVRVVLVGGDDPNQMEYAEGIRKEIERSELGGAVSMLGHRDDALRILSGSDVVVIPSVPDDRGMGREASPLVALEAMAVGTPLVVYGDGGLPELVGECASLVGPGDRQGLCEGIWRVLTDPALHDELAACGHHRVKKQFSLEAMTDAMRDCYRTVARQ